MNIIDTHSHIYQPDFDKDIDEIIERAKLSGVETILLPNIDSTTIDRVHKLSERYQGYCLPMMGLHPTSVNENWQAESSLIKLNITQYKYVGVGEIGIDLYWDKSFEKEQRLAFEEQLRWSIEFGLPVAVHSRDAIKECIECIYNVGSSKLRGVFHSFGGTTEELEDILTLKNFYIGINGVVTFKNSTLSEVLKATDLSKIIIETDAPYLAPVPYRGKRNEPSYTIEMVKKLAEIYSISLNEVADVTTTNAKSLFSI